MFREAAAAPAVVRDQLQANRGLVEEIGDVLRQRAPRAVVTCARGSSDHAATFAKYLIETRIGLLASSAAPSVSSIYASEPDLDGVLLIAISQSGASPDVLATVAAARKSGALVLALVNTEESPLARAAHYVLPLRAGVLRKVEQDRGGDGDLGRGRERNEPGVFSDAQVRFHGMRNVEEGVKGFSSICRR